MQGGTYPLLVVPCKRGGIPCLTPEQARSILNNDERLISISIFDASIYANPCKKSKKSFAQFCGLHDFDVVATIRSPHIGMHASASASDVAIAGDHEKGRLTFTVDKWNDIITSIRPSGVIPLYDAVSILEPQGRRRQIAYSRSQRWSTATDKTCNVIHCKSIKPLITLTEKTEFVFAEELCQNETLRQYADRLEEIGKNHKVEHLLCAAVSLPTVIACLQAGVQLIECALPWALAAKGIGLTFDIYPTADAVPRRHNTQINLNDNDFAMEVAPLAHNCGCYTCQRHTRAYIHHLLTVQEMNSEILLVIHNLFHLVNLVRVYRQSTAAEREKLADWVLGQL